MIGKLAVLLVALSLALPAGIARAQAQRPAATPPVAAPAPAPAETALQPPYEPQLMRLAEIMGALHYLRTLCRAPETGAWRREMQALLDSEAAGGERRERLTQSFNRGYAGFEQTHRSCTPAAQMATRRYVDEGQRIVIDITGRYVN
jgi:uncharacterized protein (TIGR02301 family)